ncbi:DedA family protein [Micromonospora sp. KC606]|uniref:DedA family protein n=1 Tax=Micromonospora sp. KC606 TaxID=2530379 RepID=UPI00104C01AD|nr:DedA family protein [Micromonospora sp. KC606]TDC78450.1 DedA family protein [Micromonospora sp. KC606]
METVLDLLRHTVTSPWVYLVIFVVTAVDAFFPAVPAETVVITAGVFAASGEPDLAAVIVAATLGALVGDHVSYAIGRAGGAHRLARLPAGSRRRASSDWARRAVDQRGGSILTTSRYVPGGRTAVTLTMGALRYPPSRFLLFDAIASLSWGAYCALLGYFGGLAFERDPVRGLLVGLGLSLAVTGLLELVRWLSHRRSATHR